MLARRVWIRFETDDVLTRAGAMSMAVTGHLTRSMFDRYNIVSEDDLRAAMLKTTLYVDTLPTTRKEFGEFSESQPR